MKKQEALNWKCRARLLKYNANIEPYRGREYIFHQKFKPYEIIEMEDNCLLNTGIDEMWELVAGDSANHYGTANAQLGVGDSTVAAAATQTDLQAASNKTYKGMESGYPTHTAQKITMKSSFGTGDANYAWQEWVIRQSGSSICLNRKVESMGTKASGTTWTLESDITLS